MIFFYLCGAIYQKVLKIILFYFLYLTYLLTVKQKYVEF
jgi:hypothetical protein